MHSRKLHNQGSPMYVPDQRVFKCATSLTAHPVAQRWEVKNCPVPEHNAGVLTYRLGIALLVISAGCVGSRFLARWRINNSTIGLDDWSILVAYALMVPATTLIIIMTQNGKLIWFSPGIISSPLF